MVDWKSIKKAADEDTYMNPDEDPNGRPSIVDDLLAKRFGRPGDEMDPGHAAPPLKPAANPNVDYMRSALRSVYGRNNIDLSDDAYVQRKFNGMMNAGNKVYRQRLMAAYNEARQNGSGMTAAQGANVVPGYGYAGQGVNQGGVAPGKNPKQQAYARQRAAIEAIRQRNRQVSQAYKNQAEGRAIAANIQPSTPQQRAVTARRSLAMWNGQRPAPATTRPAAPTGNRQTTNLASYRH